MVKHYYEVTFEKQGFYYNIVYTLWTPGASHTTQIDIIMYKEGHLQYRVVTSMQNGNIRLVFKMVISTTSAVDLQRLPSFARELSHT